MSNKYEILDPQNIFFPSALVGECPNPPKTEKILRYLKIRTLPEIPYFKDLRICDSRTITTSNPSSLFTTLCTHFPPKNPVQTLPSNIAL